MRFIRDRLEDAFGAVLLVAFIWLAYVFLWAVFTPEGQDRPFPFLPAEVDSDADPESHSTPWVDVHKSLRVGVFILEDSE